MAPGNGAIPTLAQPHRRSAPTRVFGCGHAGFGTVDGAFDSPHAKPDQEAQTTVATCGYDPTPPEFFGRVEHNVS